MRALTAAVLEYLIETIEGLDDAPASLNQPSADLLEAVSRPPPDFPGDIASLLSLVGRAAHQSYQTSGPSYLGYIPGGGIFTSALAGFLGAGMNRYTGKVATAPALVAMEESVLRWMCDLFRFPVEAQGLLTTGGSMANLIALTAARTLRAEGQVDRATVYVGEHAHGSIVKAARTAGISREHVRIVRSTADLRLDVAHLDARLREDRDAGLIPVCVFAAAGTTNTGTIDPLADICTAAHVAGAWFHVDAAYGGLFQLTARGRERLAGIATADSITLDPHKAMFLPFGTGALVVRSREALRLTFSENADYMQDLQDPGSLPDFDALTPELTREFRGLRMWLPLHLHGVAAFRDQLDEKLALTEIAYDTLRAHERLEVPWRPDLTVVVFRLAGRDDTTQLRLLDRINATQRVLLSSTRLEGSVYLRLTILSFRTHAGRVSEALEIISLAADEVT
ncbi:MAG: aminotransferase class V-fold PLP-dependent enzyme [Alphaproteobacteria bacterium]|nr:aminotransferase class V-fold PLP-dependent enzyme [Alphaproteobacteria bacterium]MCB9686057.1 aminotransferase class V-fold PLP-dependent enzyme [Alphaproteobacteria bacterium]